MYSFVVKAVAMIGTRVCKASVPEHSLHLGWPVRKAKF